LDVSLLVIDEAFLNEQIGLVVLIAIHILTQQLSSRTAAVRLLRRLRDLGSGSLSFSRTYLRHVIVVAGKAEPEDHPGQCR
jgi:hypothetical protein